MYTREQIDAFIASRDNISKDSWYETERGFAKSILMDFMEYYATKRYQVLYKAPDGEYSTTYVKYADEEEFSKDFAVGTKFIKLLKDDND